VAASAAIGSSVCYRLQEDQLYFGYDLVITGRQRDPLPTFSQIDRELVRLLSRAGLRKPVIVRSSDPANGTNTVQPDHPALLEQELMLPGENK
jgi:hypothetical protein